MSQQDQILQHMKRKRTITPMKALDYFGCFRLASVIHRLRQEGYVIVTEMRESKSTGNKYAQYRLVK